MKKICIPYRIVLVLLLSGMAWPLHAQKPELTLQDIHASAAFYGRGFDGGRWASTGPVVTYIEQNGDGTDLVSYNLETEERTLLIEGAQLKAPDVNRLIAIEDYTYSTDQSKVLLYTDSEQVWRLNTKGYYYVFDLATKTLTPVSPRDRGFQMFAKFSPDSRYVAFVRNRNLYLVDLQTKEEKALTNDGSDNGIINGTTDWVYEEEFGLRDAWSWSPDGRFIAFLQLDESKTRDFQLVDQRGFYPEVESFKYPKAGEVNSEIRAGVITIPSGTLRFFDTGTWQAGGDSLEYIPTFGWAPPAQGKQTVFLFRMNRDQNDLDLLYGDPDTGRLRTILQEREKTWIEVETGFSDLDVGMLTYLDDGRHFVWISDRDGYRHLYLYTNDGRLVRRLTEGPWDVTEFHGVDEKGGRLVFTATAESPMERHLYQARFSTKTKDAIRPPVKITSEAGWHGVNLSRDLNYYIDSYSNATTPTVVSLHDAAGKTLKVLEPNTELIEHLKIYDLAAPEFMTVPGGDGQSLNAYLIKPKNFDSNRRYPLLIHVYGGPGSQEVRNQWGGPERIWHNYLAEKCGVLVAGVDNRGTNGRGKAFMSAVYKQLGQLETADQIAAARYFGEQSYIDPERIGIWGWSYGGYMTLMSMLAADGPDVFKVGVAVAPVADWKLYDTIYTERFMSTPQKNPDGYQKAAPIHYADRLKDTQKLLIIHGDADDNVHYQNTVQMIDALQKAARPFSMMVYPGKNHGIYGGLTRLHLYSLITDFVKNNL